MIHASRIALGIGLVATGIAMLIGIVVGGLMGWFSGVVDLAGMRLVEIFEAVPTLFLLLTFVAFFGRSLYLMMVIIGLTGWTGYARFVRAEFLRLREQDYVQAAVACGLPLRSILFRHMLPNGVAPILVAASFGIASAILAEAMLSFLGLGLVDDPSWGQMLNQAVRSSTFNWWMAVFPGGANLPHRVRLQPDRRGAARRHRPVPVPGEATPVSEGPARLRLGPTKHVVPFPGARASPASPMRGQACPPERSRTFGGLFIHGLRPGRTRCTRSQEVSRNTWRNRRDDGSSGSLARPRLGPAEHERTTVRTGSFPEARASRPLGQRWAFGGSSIAGLRPGRAGRPRSQGGPHKTPGSTAGMSEPR